MASLRGAVKQVLHVEQVEQNLTARVARRLQPDHEAMIDVAVQHILSECRAMLDQVRSDHAAAMQQAALEHQAEIAATADRTMTRIRAEYTVMPRFQFHQPLDYAENTYPAAFDPPEYVSGVELPLPGPKDRMGYAPEDAREYLSWGALDHGIILGHIQKHSRDFNNRTILDFGCSSGRVLRHFEAEHRTFNWQLFGVDIQAHPIEWMRYHFPRHFQVASCATMPHLPFPDASIDFIYGISVFTHIKYLWDMWLLELRRVLKPGGLLMQSIHAEPAWEFYNKNRNEDWVKKAHSAEMLDKAKMDVDYLYYGDASCSQVFWKEEVARRFWGRYFDVLEVTPPPARSFQSWMICRKSP